MPGDQGWVEEDTRDEAGSGTQTPLGEIAVLITFILMTESQVCEDAKSYQIVHFTRILLDEKAARLAEIKRWAEKTQQHTKRTETGGKSVPVATHTPCCDGQSL